MPGRNQKVQGAGPHLSGYWATCSTCPNGSFLLLLSTSQQLPQPTAQVLDVQTSVAWTCLDGRGEIGSGFHQDVEHVSVVGKDTTHAYCATLCYTPLLQLH